MTPPAKAPHFGATLRRVRESLGLTRPSLCLQAGLSLTALTRWESTEVFDGRRHLLHALLLALENESARVKRPIAPADVKILHAPIEDEPPTSLDTSAAGIHVGDVFLSGALLATVALAVGEFGTARVRGLVEGLLASGRSGPPAPPAGAVAVHHSSGVTEYVPQPAAPADVLPRKIAGGRKSGA